MSLSKNEFNDEHAMLLREKHNETLKNIRELQEIEKYMFQNLEKVSGIDNRSEEESQIVNKINELSEMRMGLFSQLKNMYSSNQEELNSSRSQLADQITVVGVVEDELNRLKTNIDLLNTEKNNKTRMVQIGNYESDRYQAHISIMQIVVISSLIILASSLLLQNGIIPGSVSSGIIMITVAGSIIMIMTKIFDMISRNNMDYNKYDFTTDPEQLKPGYETVYEHDKIFFDKLGGEIRSEYNKTKKEISDTMDGLSKTVSSAESDLSKAISSSGSDSSSLTSNTMNKPNATVNVGGSTVKDSDPKNIENFANY